MKFDIANTLSRLVTHIKQLFSHTPTKNKENKRDPLSKGSQREDEVFPKSFYDDHDPK